MMTCIYYKISKYLKAFSRMQLAGIISFGSYSNVEPNEHFDMSTSTMRQRRNIIIYYKEQMKDSDQEGSDEYEDDSLKKEKQKRKIQKLIIGELLFIFRILLRISTNPNDQQILADLQQCEDTSQELAHLIQHKDEDQQEHKSFLYFSVKNEISRYPQDLYQQLLNKIEAVANIKQNTYDFYEQIRELALNEIRKMLAEVEAEVDENKLSEIKSGESRGEGLITKLKQLYEMLPLDWSSIAGVIGNEAKYAERQQKRNRKLIMQIWIFHEKMDRYKTRNINRSTEKSAQKISKFKIKSLSKGKKEKNNCRSLSRNGPKKLPPVKVTKSIYRPQLEIK